MSDSTLGQGMRIRPPLLDRLLDSDPDAPAQTASSTAAAIEELRAAVRRDVELLLNARRRRLPPPPGLAELGVSPLGYGVPDPTAGSFTDEARRQAMADEIATAIRRFEPRLTAVSVSLAKLPRDALLDRTLRIRIEAVLRSDPVPEHITFETLLRPTTLEVAVREG